MPARHLTLFGGLILLVMVGSADAVEGWLRWRGPEQNGAARGPGVAIDRDAAAKLIEHVAWTVDLHGRGAAVIGDYEDQPRLFVGGYRGERDKLVEILACIDPRNGQVIWEKVFPDFLSDIIYDRYSIGAPSIDGETGNVYWLTSPGLLVCYDRQGNEHWRVSMMEQYGRLTFPNGRTGSPTLHEDKVIVNAITSNWGREGPGRNRFYAFDKKTGELIWSSDPGVGPPFLKDSSFSTPIFEIRDGVDVFYAGLGDGNIVCVNADTGAPIWRWQMAVGGVNASPVIWRSRGNGDDARDRLITIHGQENVHDTGRGFMAAIDLDQAMIDSADAKQAADFKPPFVLKDDQHLLWRNDALGMFTSSPTLTGDEAEHIYQLSEQGVLYAIDPAGGAIVWRRQLASSTLHASPLYADGVLFVPIWQHGLFVVNAADGQVIAHHLLEGDCLGSPTLWNGRLFVHTTAKLYCFNVGSTRLTAPRSEGGAEPAQAAALLIRPAEVLMKPGERVALSVKAVDAAGHDAGDWMSGESATWESFVPPSARVRALLDAEVDTEGHLVAAASAGPSAGAMRATRDGLIGEMRGRILPSPPYTEDFESFDLSETRKDDGVRFAYPPLPWIGARLKFDVRDDPTQPGNKVFAKVLDNILFQRAMVFIGHPDDRGYTVAADVMTDGNRRNMSVVGVINQRYIIALDANKQAIEVSSNHDRVKQDVSFAIQPRTWYRLVSRVDVHEDGTGVVRARAWKRGDAEPEAWTIEAPVPHVHTQGSPGLYGFSPSNRFSVYIDNVEVKPHE